MRRVLNKFFPKAKLKTSTIWESEIVKPDFFDGEISNYNIFDQTPYEYKGLFHNEYGFSVSKLPVFLRTILAFHKNQCYDFEREIRLLLEPEFLPDSCFEDDFCQKKELKSTTNYRSQNEMNYQ
jgi:hypothetical protein